MDDMGSYQVSIEKNKKNRGQTEEIKEYFDGKKNIGISTTLFGFIKVLSYNYYSTNELITVTGGKLKWFS